MTEEKKARITIWEPLIQITLWNDTSGTILYWLCMIAIGWNTGFLVWSVVS